MGSINIKHTSLSCVNFIRILTEPFWGIHCDELKQKENEFDRDGVSGDTQYSSTDKNEL